MMVINNIYKTIKTNQLNRLKNGRLIKFGKCKCLHAGHGNLDVNCKNGRCCSKYYSKRKIIRSYNNC